MARSVELASGERRETTYLRDNDPELYEAPPATVKRVESPSKKNADATPARPLEATRSYRRSVPGTSSRDRAFATKLKPMWGFEHDPKKDVVMALGFGYSRREFARFISTLRGTDYGGDIVLAGATVTPDLGWGLQ